jgi:hypothetical protein
MCKLRSQQLDRARRPGRHAGAKQGCPIARALAAVPSITSPIRAYRLEEAASAPRAMETGHVRGKLVFVM